MKKNSFVSICLLTACGGGGGSSSNNNANPSQITNAQAIRNTIAAILNDNLLSSLFNMFSTSVRNNVRNNIDISSELEEIATGKELFKLAKLESYTFEKFLKGIQVGIYKYINMSYTCLSYSTYI